MEILKRLLFCAFRLLLAGVLMCPRAYGQAAANVPQLEAVFLFNFTKFVQWPSDAFSDDHAPLIIGVLGTDPFGKVLDDTLQNESVNGHKLVVQRYRSVAEIKSCQILFVSRSESGRWSQILDAVKQKPTLVVSDMDAAARRGAVIGFVNDHNHVKLQVNTTAARTAHLTLSSKLVRVAENVTPEKA
jgi:hypothetical protein